MQAFGQQNIRRGYAWHWLQYDQDGFHWLMLYSRLYVNISLCWAWPTFFRIARVLSFDGHPKYGINAAIRSSREFTQQEGSVHDATLGDRSIESLLEPVDLTEPSNIKQASGFDCGRWTGRRGNARRRRLPSSNKIRSKLWLCRRKTAMQTSGENLPIFHEPWQSGEAKCHW